jgi:hypothetical protein
MEQEKLQSIQKEFDELCARHKVNIVPILNVTQNGIVPAMTIVEQPKSEIVVPE